MSKLHLKTPEFSRTEFIQRAQKHLQEFQKTLLPEHAHEFIAINVVAGEYVLGATAHDAAEAFLNRWPDTLMYRCRVDGGPATKFYGK